METINETSRWRFYSPRLALVIISMLLSPVVSSALWAGDRALLIAVTEYADPVNNLPGIELDLMQMEKFVQKIGFTDENTRTLLGADVTLENVRKEFSGFLSEGVDKDDTIFIYYTGHGMQVPDRNGDEEDRRDEAISLYNLTPAVSGWDGVLLDDEFAQLLRALPSENVLVVVDACHSGTVTRSYEPRMASTTRAFRDDEFVVKALKYRGTSGATGGFVKNPGAITDEIPEGVVALSAAQDHQLSLASSQGSLFTLALAQSLDAQRTRATAESLITGATAILEAQLDDQQMFLPNLSGDKTLFAKRLIGDDAAEIPRVNWGGLVNLVKDLPPIEMISSKTLYVAEELIGLQVMVPEDGYINIIAVDENDDMVVLFPNAQDSDNQVLQGRNAFPGDRNFDWAAQAPWGNTMIVSLYSREPVNLFDSSTQRSVDGQATVDFVLPPLAGLLEYGLQRSTKAGGLLFVKTCEADASC